MDVQLDETVNGSLAFSLKRDVSLCTADVS